MRDRSSARTTALKVLFICFFAAGLFSVLFLRLVVTAGRSMEPTYHSGDRLLSIHDFCAPEPGDTVLIFHDGRYMVKRVQAVAGEPVSIDGEAFDPYWGEDAVPEGYIFVVGDNLANSSDSRDEGFGLVPLEEVEGFILCRLWSGLEGGN